MSAGPFPWTSAWACATGVKIWEAHETSSTNSIAKDDEAAETKPRLLSSSDGLRTDGTMPACSDPTLYLAKQQTQGRGRGSHTWLTPEGAALLSSWSFGMRSVPQPILAPLVGLALFESAKDTWPEVSFNLKAPNDLYIDEKKTAGLLIETVDMGTERRTIVGLGLNVMSKPSEVPTATCLTDHVLVDESNWRSFLDAWLKRLTIAMSAGQNTSIDPDHARRLKEALNLHPLLKEPILKVDELGQLHSASRVIHWHEL